MKTYESSQAPRFNQLLTRREAEFCAALMRCPLTQVKRIRTM